MNFDHTDDRRMLVDSLNRYISKRYTFETRDKIVKSALSYSQEHWQQFAEIGVIGALFDETVGGYGGSGFDLSVVFEALGRGLVVEPFFAAVLAGSAITHAGNDAQRLLLDEIIAGTNIVALAHSEADGGYTINHAHTIAKRNGDGWLIDGAKAAVQYGAQADYLIVSARTGGNDDDHDGISLFIVPQKTPGITLHAYPNIDGGAAAELILNAVSLPATALLGASGAGYATLEHSIGRGVLALCAEAVGAMDIAKQATLEYLQTREQFGVPIGSFQALQHRMADLLVEIEQARSAVINAAAALDHPGLVREKTLSAAKYTIGRIGALVAEECIQLHGGIGMTWELPLAHYAKRLVMIDHQLGDEDFHLERYIALAS
jgi:alkylation response protein AidB-like acyl-CoA dehydrogenase